MLQRIFAFRFSYTGKYLLQNIRLEANNHKTLCDFHIQDNIRLQIFAYQLKLQMRLRFLWAP
jgi:hypothetical protein